MTKTFDLRAKVFRVLLCALPLVLARVQNADALLVQYEYTGQLFTSFGCSGEVCPYITPAWDENDRLTAKATFILPSDLSATTVPESFVFEAGRSTLVDESPFTSFDGFFEIVGGEIVSWDFTAQHSILSVAWSRIKTANSGDTASYFTTIGLTTYESASASLGGTWRIVPEPGSMTLLGIGLVRLGLQSTKRMP